MEHAKTTVRQYQLLKSKAKQRGLLVGISFDEFKFLRSQNCYYCGGVLCETGHSLDRKDNSVGYISSNVAPCCGVCNYAKKGMSVDEFLSWAKRVADHNRS